MPTYLPAPPDLDPMFLERRVYQYSNGTTNELRLTSRFARIKRALVPFTATANRNVFGNMIEIT